MCEIGGRDVCIHWEPKYANTAPISRADTTPPFVLGVDVDVVAEAAADFRVDWGFRVESGATVATTAAGLGVFADAFAFLGDGDAVAFGAGEGDRDFLAGPGDAARLPAGVWRAVSGTLLWLARAIDWYVIVVGECNQFIFRVDKI